MSADLRTLPAPARAPQLRAPAWLHRPHTRIGAAAIAVFAAGAADGAVLAAAIAGACTFANTVLTYFLTGGPERRRERRRRRRQEEEE